MSSSSSSSQEGWVSARDRRPTPHRLWIPALAPPAGGASSTEVERPQKTTRSSVLEELKCPISLALPIDPVMAEDGKIYERKFIKEWLQEHDTSPVTRAVIGKNLVASTLIKTLIENAVEESEDGTSDEKKLVKEWKRRMKEKQGMEDLIQKAESGDVDAMERVGITYWNGEKGFDNDFEKAYFWNKKAADAGLFRSMTIAGEYLLRVKQNATLSDKLQGATLLGRAAHSNGSTLACLLLGQMYVQGSYGYPKDKAQAIYYLELGLSQKCAIDDATDTDIEEMKPVLNGLLD
jgi:hypothetical protein